MAGKGSVLRKERQFPIRMSALQRRFVAEAAAAVGESFTDFCRSAIEERATRVMDASRKERHHRG